MRTFITENKTPFLTVTAVSALVGLWWLISWLAASPLLLPSPPDVFAGFIKILRSPDFFPALLATLLRGLAAFFFSLVLGTVAGVASGLSGALSTFLKPLLVTVRSTPVIAIILLGLIWFDTGTVPVFIGFLVMFPIITTNVAEGIKSVDPGLIQMATLFNVKRGRILTGVYFPAIAPFFLSGSASAMGIGWKAVIACEVLSQPHFAIGTGMQNAQTYLLVSEVLAWTLVAIFLGFLFEALLGRLEKVLTRWRSSAE